MFELMYNRYMIPIFVMILMLLTSFNIHALDSLSVYNPNTARLSYHNSNIKLQSMLIPLKSPCQIKTIMVGMCGDTGSFRVRLMGNKSNDLFPYRATDLIEPIKCKKNIYGNQEINCTLEMPIGLSERSIFVVIDSMTNGMGLQTDEKKKRAICTSENGQKYFYQSMQLIDNSWKSGYYGYVVKLYLDKYEDEVKTSFIQKNITWNDNDTIFGTTIALQDIDSDGYIDILSNGKLLKNNGDFTFTDVSKQYNLKSLPEYNAFVDINADGKYEIICLNDKINDNSNKIFSNVENKYIGEEITSIPKFDSILNAVVSDINLDTYPDLIVYSKSNSGKLNLNIYVNDGQGNFKEISLYQQEYSEIDKYSFVVTDFNNDNKNDIIYSSPQGIQIIENFGNLNFTNITSELIPDYTQDKLKQYQDIYIQAHDVDSDGNIDFLISGTSRNREMILNSNNLIVLKNLGVSNQFALSPDSKYDSLFTPNRNGCTLMSDFDNNGNEDILFMPGCNCYFPELYLQDQSKRLSTISHTSNFYNKTISKDALVVDMNNDGLNDLLCNENGILSLYKNALDSKGRNVKVKYSQSGLQNKIYDYECVVHIGDQIKRYTFYPQVAILMHSVPDINISISKNDKIDSIIVYDKKENKIVYKDTVIGDKETIIVSDLENGKLPLSNLIANHQATPNPFSDNVKISFELSRAANISVSIYSVSGNKITDLFEGYCNSGLHSYEWNSVNNVGISTTNTYLYKIIVEGQEYVGQLVRIN